jgi:hypothetical protein
LLNPYRVGQGGGNQGDYPQQDAVFKSSTLAAGAALARWKLPIGDIAQADSCDPQRINSLGPGHGLPGCTKASQVIHRRVKALDV